MNSRVKESEGIDAIILRRIEVYAVEGFYGLSILERSCGFESHLVAKTKKVVCTLYFREDAIETGPEVTW